MYRDLVDHINPRIWYAEGRRGSLAALAAGLLAAGIALLTHLLTSDPFYRPAYWALFAVAGGAMATGATTLVVYAAQTNFDYPFKKVTSTWKWFYRDAIPGTAKIKVPWYTIQSDKSRSEARSMFDREWPEFATRHKSLLKPRVSAAQDLQQLYVLHMNEFYKNKFLTHLRRIVTWGIAATAVVAALVFLVVL
jgi:hypothetical protein